MDSNTVNGKSVDFKDFSIEDRKVFLNKSSSKKLLSALPKKIRESLVYSFLNNINKDEAPFVNPEWKEVLKYFFLNSRMVPEIAQDPGTFTMLDRMYWQRNVDGPIDQFFYNCLAGESLRNRLKAVSNRLCQEIIELKDQPEVNIIDLGSGPGDYPVQAIKQLPSNIKKIVKVDCFEIDSKAIEEGRRLVEKENIDNFNFHFENIITYRHYRQKADIALLIGILCPLKKEEGIKFLRSLRRYIKPGGKLIAATLLDQQLKDDLFPSYLAKEISGWNLDYKRPGDLKEMFATAGYICEETFSDDPTKFYDICIGSVR